MLSSSRGNATSYRHSNPLSSSLEWMAITKRPRSNKTTSLSSLIMNNRLPLSDDPSYYPRPFPESSDGGIARIPAASLLLSAGGGNSNGGEGRIESLGPWDILCGRSRRAFFHTGNRRFRVTISLNYRRYMEARNRGEKTAVTMRVINVLKNEVGARFLKEVNGGEYYVELSPDAVKEKITHALRDAAANQRLLEREQASKKPSYDANS